MKLFRYIVPIFFFFLSLGAVGQVDSIKIEIDSSLYRKANVAIEEDNCESCKCFWLVFDKITLESISFLDEEIPKIKRYLHDDKVFLQIEPQEPTASILTVPGPLSIGINDHYIHIKWRHCKTHGEEVINLPSDAILIIPSTELPYYSGYVINVNLQPCESFESFLKKYKKGLYMPYQQPVFPEKTNNYEADGFKSLREW